ncbi:hypothetical protein BB561_006831 [Smittium simulii]|uniref:HMG box domain-containing protein n=1 Tax=Smittium simulii TaxID=133385 RepID=A0A2T9Y125_9FUNG|nr:hypothetical protein BB561_006831 [Smittium simulii]
MLRQPRLAKRHSTLCLATRDCIVTQHKLIPYAAVLRQNSIRLATLDSKNSAFKPISIRYYSSNRKDTNLSSVYNFEQNVPTRHSIKSLKLSNSTRDVSTYENHNKSNYQKIRDAKLLELQKLKQAKLLELQKLKKAKLLELQKLKTAKLLELKKLKTKLTQNKRISKQDLNEFKKHKLHKNSTALTQLVVPSFFNSSFKLYIQDELKKIKNDPSYTNNSNNLMQNIKNISANWNIMTESEKLEYEQKYKLLKQQHTNELYKWWDNVDKNLIKFENRRRRSFNIINKDTNIRKLPMLVDPRTPKRPASAYGIFVKVLKQSNHINLPTKPVDFIKFAAAIWTQLPESEKDIYRFKYNTAIQLYNEFLNKYK